jgi:hypothetical protein
MSDSTDDDVDNEAVQEHKQPRFNEASTVGFYNACAEKIACWTEEELITEQQLRQHLRDYMLTEFNMEIDDSGITKKLREARASATATEAARRRHAAARARWVEAEFRWTADQSRRKQERAERACRLRHPRRQAEPEDIPPYPEPEPTLQHSARQKAMHHCDEMFSSVRDRFAQEKAAGKKVVTTARQEERKSQRVVERREVMINRPSFTSMAQTVGEVERCADSSPSSSSSSSSSSTPRRFYPAAVTAVYNDYLAQQAAAQGRMAEAILQSMAAQAESTAQYRAEKLTLLEATRQYQREKLALLARGKENVNPDE